MKYQRLSPPPDLQAYVRYFWVAENTDVAIAAKTFGPIADGCPGMLLQPAETSALYDPHGYRFPTLFLYGQTIAPIRIHASGTFRTVGVFLYPDALKTIFGLDADESTNGCIDLSLHSETRTFRLPERMVDASTIHEQLEVICHYLRYQISRNSTPSDPITQYAIAQLRQSNGGITLKTLQQELQFSERSLERRFKQVVGISPKVFSQVCRFQATLRQLRTGTYDKLSDIAFDHAYADQSHFIRSFREFTGFSPHQYQKQSREVIDSFPELI